MDDGMTLPRRPRRGRGCVLLCFISGDTIVGAAVAVRPDLAPAPALAPPGILLRRRKLAVYTGPSPSRRNAPDLHRRAVY